MVSGRSSGAGVMACADVAMDKAKLATAINLSIGLLLGLSNQSYNAPCIWTVLWGLEIDQGVFGGTQQ
jgi:hypothetical protein